MSVTLRVARLNGQADLVIPRAEWLAEFFFRTSSSSMSRRPTVSYDDWAMQTPPNCIVVEDIKAINRSMAARTSLNRWITFTQAGDVPWLAAIDANWDLLMMSDAEWAVNRCEQMISNALAEMIGPWRGPSIVTKVLHLKRPRLIPVCDDLVAKQVGGANHESQTMKVIAHIREQGRANLEQLLAIGTYLESCHPPIERTLTRIFDALLWASYPGLVPFAQFTDILGSTLLRSATDSANQTPPFPSQDDDRCPRCHGPLVSVLWDGRQSGGEYLDCESCGWRKVVTGTDPGR